MDVSLLGRSDSLIAKYLVFDFVNFYGILIYIAVAKVWVQKSGTGLLGNQEWAEQCLYRNCMLELSIQMATIFIGISLLQHLLNYLSPICQRGWSGFRRSHLAKRILKENMKNHRRRLTGAKQSNSLRRYRDLCLPQFFIDANLADAESDFILLNGYNAAVVQFGFLVLFSVAFPLAPLFGAFHNTIQRKIGT